MTYDSETRRKRGRPRDASVPARIETAARELFAERGFGDTSVRAIADAAGSSAALVIRHFGSKEQLFLRAMSLDGGLREVVDGTIDDLGRTILTRLLQSRDTALPDAWRALMLAGDQHQIQHHRRDLVRRYLFDALVTRLDGSDVEARAHLVSAQLVGLVLLLWVDQDATLVGVSTDKLIDLYAPSLQRLIDSPSPRPTPLTVEPTKAVDHVD